MGKHARILIVDDDESIGKVLATILEDEGYIVAPLKTEKRLSKNPEKNSTILL